MLKLKETLQRPSSHRNAHACVVMCLYLRHNATTYDCVYSWGCSLRGSKEGQRKGDVSSLLYHLSKPTQPNNACKYEFTV